VGGAQGAASVPYLGEISRAWSPFAETMAGTKSTAPGEATVEPFLGNWGGGIDYTQKKGQREGVDQLTWSTSVLKKARGPNTAVVEILNKGMRKKKKGDEGRRCPLSSLN